MLIRLSRWTNCTKCARTSTGCSSRDGPVVATAAATLLLQRGAAVIGTLARADADLPPLAHGYLRASGASPGMRGDGV